MKRMLSVLTALLLTVLLLTALPAGAAARLYDPIAIAAYDRLSLEDWTPHYGLNMPGVLLELSHAEGLITVSALEAGEADPTAWLESRLDQAGEMLAVSDAQMVEWADAFGGDGRLLSYSYTYPGGDETHLARFYAASWQDMLVEVSIDTWGTDASRLMDGAVSSLIEGGFTLNHCENAFELSATLTDVLEGDAGTVQLQLTASEFSGGSYYPLSPGAVVLFPHPDDPTAVYPVSPDMTSLVDAILTYEESSDSPAAFRAIIHEGQIVYMEYSLMM